MPENMIIRICNSFSAPLLDDYASFEGQDREELLQEQAVGNGFLKDRNNAFQYAVLAITVEDTNGKNRTRPELVHSVDMILQNI